MAAVVTDNKIMEKSSGKQLGIKLAAALFLVGVMFMPPPFVGVVVMEGSGRSGVPV